MIRIDDDQFIVATNCDLEVYKICKAQKSFAENLNGTKELDAEKNIKLKEMSKHRNAHKDSILCINKISGTKKFFLLLIGNSLFFKIL